MGYDVHITRKQRWSDKNGPEIPLAEWIAVVVPRLSSRVGFPPIGDRWKDTIIGLPQSLRREGVKEIFTSQDLHADDAGIRVSEAMGSLPFAIYSNGL